MSPSSPPGALEAGLGYTTYERMADCLAEAAELIME
jgi:hypothetical protein